MEVAVAPVVCGAAGAVRYAGDEALDTASLSDAFGRFIRSSSRLEDVYRQLRAQVDVLTRELAERNAELQRSLEANETMRLTLQQILDALPCGVLVVRAEGTVAMLNPECRRMLRFEGQGDELCAELDLAAWAERAGVQCAWALDHDAEADAEREFCMEDGRGSRWLSLKRREIRGCGETVFVLRDVTARRRAEEQRERGRNAMAIAEMATVLAHEIRNPLASLELFSELIEADEERRAEWIANLRAVVRLLSSTVDNVLSFSGGRPLSLAPVPMSDVARSAVALLQPVARQAGAALSLVTDAANDAVLGNAAGLQQVMVNLILNALRHTPAGGSVTVTVRECEGRDGWLAAECVDTGPGIAESLRLQIFEAGYSGDGATPGLGLAVCDRIVAQHGGRLRAEAALTGGARFTMEIPAMAGEAVA